MRDAAITSIREWELSSASSSSRRRPSSSTSGSLTGLAELHSEPESESESESGPDVESGLRSRRRRVVREVFRARQQDVPAWCRSNPHDWAKVLAREKRYNACLVFLGANLDRPLRANTRGQVRAARTAAREQQASARVVLDVQTLLVSWGLAMPIIPTWPARDLMSFLMDREVHTSGDDGFWANVPEPARGGVAAFIKRNAPWVSRVPGSTLRLRQAGLPAGRRKPGPRPATLAVTGVAERLPAKRKRKR